MDPSNLSMWQKEQWQAPPAAIMVQLQERLSSLEPGYPRTERFVEKLCDYVFYSNRAEGIPGDIGDTKAIIKAKLEGDPANSADLTLSDVELNTCKDESHVLNRRFVLQHFIALVTSRTLTLEKFTVENIKHLHFLLMQGLNHADKDAPVTPGVYRTHDCHATGLKSRDVHYFAEGIEERMSALVRQVRDMLAHSTHKGVCPEMFFIAGKFLVEFLHIHPFGDGNGRLSRLLTNWILHLHGFPSVVMLIKGPHRNALKHYLRVLDRVQHNGCCVSLAATFVLESALDAIPQM